MKRRLVVGLLPWLVLACNPIQEQHHRAVAKIDGVDLTRDALDAYLEMNLAEIAPVVANPTDGDPQDDLVRSLLLDGLIEDRLVLAEADRRRLTIRDDQLDALLDDPAYESGPTNRRNQRTYLRERLLIELVQGQVLSDIEFPTPEEATAWLAENPGEADAGRKVRLRSLRFDDGETALKVHRNLRRDRLTFNEAVVQNSDDESQGVATIMDWESLPPEVREVLQKLRQGWSSAPVDLGGSTYLFQLVEWIEPDPQVQIAAAQEGMFSATRRAAWERFVAGLRARADIEIVPKNLPFRYVSEREE